MKRAVLGLLALTACAPPEPPAHPAAPVGAPTPAPTPPLGDADITAKSHAILEAFDHRDVATVTAALGAHYIHFEGSYTERAGELAQLAKPRPDSESIARRTWSEERVFAQPGSAMFIGKAHEHQAGNDLHGGYDFDGWYSLGWAYEDGAWKLVYWGWQIDGAQSQTATWNQIYGHGTGFEHAANKLLVDYTAGEHAAKHEPGTALDIAMGQGRNALYLAEQGWHVTGVDISDEGVRQARAAAEAKQLTIDAVVADLKTYDYGVDRYDLVAMIYAWPAIPRIADVQKSLRHGGLFVYEFFAPEGDKDVGPPPGALAKQFAGGWEILRDDITDGVPDWAADRAKIQRFVARKR